MHNIAQVAAAYKEWKYNILLNNTTKRIQIGYMALIDTTNE